MALAGTAGVRTAGGPAGTLRLVAICSPALSPNTPLWFQSTQALSTQAAGPPAVTEKVAVAPGANGPPKVTPSSSSPGAAQVPKVEGEVVASSPLAAVFWLK